MLDMCQQAVLLRADLVESADEVCGVAIYKIISITIGRHANYNAGVIPGNDRMDEQKSTPRNANAISGIVGNQAIRQRKIIEGVQYSSGVTRHIGTADGDRGRSDASNAEMSIVGYEHVRDQNS
jgi:hypothetical protein